MAEDLRKHIDAEIDYAYRQLRAHLHDPWAGHCYPCDRPGPCLMHRHWLARLEALEAAAERLDGGEE